MDSVLGAGSQLLEVVLEPAVARDADHRAVGFAGLGADTGGEGEAQTRPTVGVHEGAGLVDIQTPAGPAGGDRRVQREYGVPGGNLADRLEDLQLVAPGLLQHLADLALGGRDLVHEAASFVDVLVAYSPQPLLHHGLGVGDDGHSGVVVLADGIAVQKNMNQVLGHAELHTGGGTLGQDGSQGHDHVTGAQPFLHRVLTPDAPAQDLAQGLGMVLGEGALGPVGGDHGRAQFLGQLDDLLDAALHLDFLAHHDGRPLGLEQHLERLLNLIGVALGHLGLTGGQYFHVRLFAQQVGGYLQSGGPGASGLETVKDLHQIVGDGLYLVHRDGPVGHRLQHGQLVLGLVGGVLARAHEFLLHVGGDLQYRRAREVGLAQGAHRVRGAGPGAGDQHSGFAGGPGVAVGHEAAAQLQAAADEAHAVLAGE